MLGHRELNAVWCALFLVCNLGTVNQNHRYNITCLSPHHGQVHLCEETLPFLVQPRSQDFWRSVVPNCRPVNLVFIAITQPGWSLWQTLDSWPMVTVVLHGFWNFFNIVMILNLGFEVMIFLGSANVIWDFRNNLWNSVGYHVAAMIFQSQKLLELWNEQVGPHHMLTIGSRIIVEISCSPISWSTCLSSVCS